MVTIYYAASTVLGLFAAASLWGAVHGVRRRDWKFAGAALVLVVIFSLAAVQVYGASQGDRYRPDPHELRIR